MTSMTNNTAVLDTAALEAARAEWQSIADKRGNWSDALTAAIRVYLAALNPVGVGVKALEWREEGDRAVSMAQREPNDMTITSFERNASIAEMAVELDRRGVVIEKLEAEIEHMRAHHPASNAGAVGEAIRDMLKPEIGPTIDYTLANYRRIRRAFQDALSQAPAAPATAKVGVDWEREVDDLVQSIIEWDDRTSPDGYPDHLLITGKELKEFARDVAALAGTASLRGEVAPVAWQIKDTRDNWITLPGDWQETENLPDREYRPLYAHPPKPAIDAGASLDERMIAAGMIPLSKLLAGDTPLAKWEAHTGVRDLKTFEEWLLRRHREFMRMRVDYDLGDKDKTDDLYEWVFAHAGALSEVVANFRAALLQAPEGAAAEGWQPIETAPREGTLVLLSSTDWPPSVQLGKPFPVKVGGWWDGMWHVFGASWTPTHWRHLPAAPETEQRNG